MKCPLCRIEKSSLHTCPRCGAEYCGIPCYKAHSEVCGTAATEDHVEEVLRSERADEDLVKSTEGLVRRFRETFARWDDNAADDLPEIDEERYELLLTKATEGTISLVDLNHSEAQLLAEQLRDGNLMRLANAWMPWWEAQHSMPARAKVLDHICCSKSQKASPTVIFSIFPICFAYAALWRYTLGDASVLASELGWSASGNQVTAQAFLQCLGALGNMITLKPEIPPASAAECASVCKLMPAVVNPVTDQLQDRDWQASAFGDASTIVKSQEFTCRLLSHLLHFTRMVKKNSDDAIEYNDCCFIQRVSHFHRRLKFLLSFVANHTLEGTQLIVLGDDLLISLGDVVRKVSAAFQ